MRDVVFYLIGAAMLATATATVTLRNLFHSALALLGTLFASAALFLLLGAEMVALGQVMVYIGGIMVFVLYAVFLTSDLGAKMPAPGPFKGTLGFFIAVAVFALVAGKAWRGGMQLTHGEAVTGFASLKGLGVRLLHPGAEGFLVPFEWVSVLLLAAMVGALAVARGLSGRPEGAAEEIAVDKMEVE